MTKRALKWLWPSPCVKYISCGIGMLKYVLAVEADKTSSSIAAEMGVASFILAGEGRHLVQNGPLFPFSLSYS